MSNDEIMANAKQSQGPKAPKDPDKQRKKIYLMSETSIEAMKRPDGTFSEIIYLENRVEAKVSVICPELPAEIAAALPVSEQFRRLVHSIGVTVTADAEENRSERFRFQLQNYGKTDKYVTGSVHEIEGYCDGAERRTIVDDWVEAPDDDILGTIYFYFDKPGISGKATIVFYLNDGYDVPEPVLDPPVAYDTPAYDKMIEQSLVSSGDSKRLQNALLRAKRGEEVTIAFIGGSITQGAGAKPQVQNSYAYQTYQALKEYLQAENLKFVKAGVGGTSSEFGIVRYDRDVRKDGAVEPDIVVVEYAVNDEGDETKGVCYESLVRKIWKGRSEPAVVLLFAVFMNDWNLQPRLEPVGRHYNLPMVSIRDGVVPQFSSGERVISKRQFFYDLYHPSNDGHRIMKDCLMNLFTGAVRNDMKENGQCAERQNQGAAVQRADMDSQISSAAAFSSENGCIGTDFANLVRIDRRTMPAGIQAMIAPGGFGAWDEMVPAAEFDDREVAEKMFADNWYHAQDAVSEPFEMEIVCKRLIVVYKDEGDASVGAADVYVDDTFVRKLDPHEVGWLHCNTAVICNTDACALHRIRIQMCAGDEHKRFTIMGFGVVTE